MLIGLDLLGLGSKYFKPDAVIKAFNKYREHRFAIGCFDDCPGTFGDPRESLRKILRTGRVDTVRVQLWYDRAHSLCPISHMKERLKLWAAFMKEFPQVAFYISHTTEHNEDNKTLLKERMALIREMAPWATPVNNPANGAILSGEVNETHDFKPLPGTYFASMDGMGDPRGANGAWDIDVIRWHKAHARAKIRFVWVALFNLNDFKKPLGPRERTAAPSQKHVEATIMLGSLPVDAPILPKAQKVKAPQLYKPLSQDSGKPREDKPLAIFAGKEKVTSYDVVAANGKVLGKFMYPGDAIGGFTGGMRRYYAGWPGGIDLWGHEIAWKAIAACGSPWICLVTKIKNETIRHGWIHPAFRTGYFRG